jgi:diadenosine tetraphosphate (Ap4A) HIT family hydrolase
MRKNLFKLDPRIAQVTFFIKDLPFSRLLLMNDSNYPWLILVPRVTDKKEIFELSIKERVVLENEINLVSKLAHKLFKADKINIGALGNIVSQLHIHVIVRYENDPSWPKAAWGSGKEIPYTKKNLNSLISKIKLALKSL